MRNIQTSFTQHVTQLGLLGRTGEKSSRQIVFDCEKVLKEYPKATIACIFQRSDGSSPYAGSVQADGFLRKVALTATETAVAGEMQIELRAIEGDVIRKSAIFKGYIAGSLEGESDVPDSPFDDVLNRLSVVEQGAVSATEKATEAAESVKDKASEAEQAAQTASAAAEKAADAATKAENTAISAAKEVANAVEKASSAAKAAEETTAEAEEKLTQIKSDIADYQASYAETQKKANTATQTAAAAASNAQSVADALTAAKEAGEFNGKDGADGAPGEKGDKGDPGEKGEKGDTGAQGEKGETGAQGAQGEKGDKGDPGEKGDTGATGAQGAKGDKGDPGEKGDTGATGAQGEKGDKGDPGETGATGATGAQGEKGEKGDAGPTGPTGPAGADGYSPTATVVKFGSTATITVTDKDGTTTAQVSDGSDATVTKESVVSALGYTPEERPDTWTLIESVTLTEASTFSRTTKPDGTAYKLKRLHIVVESPSGVTTKLGGQYYVYCKDGTSVYAWEDNLVQTSDGRQAILLAEINRDTLTVCNEWRVKQQLWNTYTLKWTYGIVTEGTWIHSISITAGTTGELPAGTKITIYGVEM